MSYFSLGFFILILFIALALIVVALALIFYKGKNKRTLLSGSPVYNSSAETAANTSDTKICPNCKAPISDGTYFCMMCGTKVK